MGEQSESGKERALVIHPDHEIRETLVQALARVSGERFSLYELESVSAAAGASTHQLRPQLALLDLGENLNLALDVARTFRKLNCQVIGVYNPVVLSESEANMVRHAARAGVGDFIRLPVADSDLREALEAADLLGRDPTMDHQVKGRVACFFSHKGGSGVSTLALNTAIAAARDAPDLKVALFDADLQFGTIAGLAGLEEKSAIATLVKNLDKPGPIEPYLEKIPDSSVSVLPSPESVLESEKIGPEEISRIVLTLCRQFDSVIVDLPRVLDLNTLAVLDLADTIFFVTEPLPVSLDRARGVIELFRSEGILQDRTHVVLNQPAATSASLSQEEASNRLGHKIDAVIRHDSKHIDTEARGIPVSLAKHRSAVAKGTATLAKLISGID